MSRIKIFIDRNDGVDEIAWQGIDLEDVEVFYADEDDDYRREKDECYHQGWNTFKP